MRPHNLRPHPLNRHRRPWPHRSEEHTSLFRSLVYGFVFSRIETRDGKVGYIYSNLIAVDRAATAAQQAGTVRFAADKSSTPAAVVKPDAAAQPQAAPAQSAPAPVAT